MGSSRHVTTPDAPAREDLTALFARERLPMLRLAAVLLGSVPTAEDVVQDAFGEVARRWDHLDRPGAYLRACVVNGCRMVLRRQGSEQRAVGRPVELSTGLTDAQEPAELPANLVELRDALAHLGERPRVVVVLRYLLDLPDDEIAEALGCRRATVRSLAHRALATLRKELA
jgi:RNA polymerase sigma factor (sigma-70 family)